MPVQQPEVPFDGGLDGRVLWAASAADARVIQSPTAGEIAAAIDASPSALGPTLVAIEYDVARAIEPGAFGETSRVSGGRVIVAPAAVVRPEEIAGDGAFAVSPLRSGMGRARYVEAVGRGLGCIRAGDVYQVNLAHHLRGAFEGSPRALARELFRSASPRYGAYLEHLLPDGSTRAIVSLSPELFLEYDAETRRVVTRPMKGTRPASSGGEGARELMASSKDRAELNMIVDLMRNDLGRVCAPGSIRVDSPRTIEVHAPGHGGGVLQATATVSGTLREGKSLADLMLAAFPGGSVTGAPKIRAMQIIDELEDGPRGMYCGSIGVVWPNGSACFNIAIRTATIERGVLTYPVGAGIVADSDPASEWEETLVKAGVLGGVTTIEREEGE